MEVHVYDTYGRGQDGRLIHFDVLIAEQDDNKAFELAKSYMASIGEDGADSLEQRNCRFCHSEPAGDELAAFIQESGHYILKMEGCI